MSFCVLPGFGVLKVEGVDAEVFLQGQLACDVVALAVGESALGGYCTFQGKVVCVFVVFRESADVFYLVMPADVVAGCLVLLGKYGAFSKVSIEGLADWQVLGSWGRPSVDDGVIVLGLPGEERFFVCGERDVLDGFKVDVDEVRWMLEDVKVGLPFLFEACSEHFTPHMLGLVELGAVSLQKGCYCGQEIIARTEHLGKAKRHVFRFSCGGDAVVAAGVEVLVGGSGKLAGVVLFSVVESPGKVVGLAVLHESAAEDALVIGEVPLFVERVVVGRSV